MSGILLTLPRLEHLLAQFANLRIGLVGDLFLDRYLEIDRSLRELSVETGLEAYQVTRVRNSPGAMGTVINNLLALGARQLMPVSVLGDDGQSYDLLQALQKQSLDTSRILLDPERLTPTYTKPLRRDQANVWQELNRLDLRNRRPMSRSIEDRLLAMVDEAWQSSDGLIVADQVNEEGWGVVTPRLRDWLADSAVSRPDKLIFVDSRARVGKFRDVILKPNGRECRAALQMLGLIPEAASDDEPSHDEPATLAEAFHWAADLAARTQSKVFCTLGPRGMVVAAPGLPPNEVPGFPAPGAVDVVGAGDSATAGIMASLLAGATLIEAATMGNLVASITVQQLGTTGIASPEQLRQRWRECQAE